MKLYSARFGCIHTYVLRTYEQVLDGEKNDGKEEEEEEKARRNGKDP